jgi:predicted AlkP superfamily pyrophosphatase or phosphodiesterase
VNKVILILSDALRYDAAVAGMGCLCHLLEVRLSSLYKVLGELPSISRPMVETLHTGLSVFEHGVVSNVIVRRSMLQIAPTLCRLLDIPIPETMKATPLI